MRTELEAVRLRSGCVLVRPKGECGTCGWHPEPWTGYLSDPGIAEEEAIRRAREERPEWNNDEEDHVEETDS